MIKPDSWIRRKCIDAVTGKAFKNAMIEPFVDEQISKGIISYGVSSYGYDIRITDEFRIFSNMSGEVVDPKNFNSNLLIEKRAPYIDIPPNSYCLTRTVEYFRIPRNVMTICVGKSTYARCCLIVNVTPFEPEWCGFATMEISNSTTSPVRVYANEGIAQVIFFESDEMCSVSYKDKKGRYDKQMKLTLPFVEK